jgi:hypothetical protein
MDILPGFVDGFDICGEKRFSALKKLNGVPFLIIMS